ncbi:phage portal protein [Methylobacterium sp. WCS2018Hpa-22]|uniref:phage portal protein n=1 Tax=Methylobacterium sp. WCS2018Hpa-22 TaxID=3073633 RepID=UPI00288B3792|nr:phage portal protein [Methylobacterium sp. WCS2018Hpa-22]
MKIPAPNFFDRAITAVAPGYGARRYQARVALTMAGQYTGAKSKKTSLKAWQTYPGSADADTLGDLPTLRARSRDLIRNNPIATGASATSKSNVVGTGLQLRAAIDRELLGLTEEQADKWERRSEKLFNLWAKSKSADITLTQNFYQLQGLIFEATFESGDALVLRRRAKRTAVVPLALAVIEADRLATPDALSADADIRSGVRIDSDGAAVSYFVLDDHPGDYMLRSSLDYTEIPAFGEKSGEQMALHVYRRRRPEQTRGVPELAPVIEILKQLDRYSEAELMAAVVSSFFTVFLKTKDDSGLPPGADVPGMGADEVAMGPGAVVSIGTDEEVVTANPGRANANFDAFYSAVVRQIGVALSIPYELLIMHFAASYSASRAALEMAAQFFDERREWLISTFCDPVYEWFIVDAINAGLIEAPGFFESPVRRAAWLGSMWIPPTGIILDPVKEWEGEKLGVEIGALTLEEVTLRRTGGDWKQKTEQRAREHKARVEAGLEPAILDPNGTKPRPAPNDKPEPAPGGSQKD